MPTPPTGGTITRVNNICHYVNVFGGISCKYARRRRTLLGKVLTVVGDMTQDTTPPEPIFKARLFHEGDTSMKRCVLAKLSTRRLQRLPPFSVPPLFLFFYIFLNMLMFASEQSTLKWTWHG